MEGVASQLDKFVSDVNSKFEAVFGKVEAVSGKFDVKFEKLDSDLSMLKLFAVANLVLSATLSPVFSPLLARLSR